MVPPLCRYTSVVKGVITHAAVRSCCRSGGHSPPRCDSCTDSSRHKRTTSNQRCARDVELEDLTLTFGLVETCCHGTVQLKSGVARACSAAVARDLEAWLHTTTRKNSRGDRKQTKHVEDVLRTA